MRQRCLHHPSPLQVRRSPGARQAIVILILLLFLLPGVRAMAQDLRFASSENRQPVPPQTIKITPEGKKVAEQYGVGSWIWTTNFADKQICRVWRAFTISETNKVKAAILRITADNLYRLYLDGREIGEGGNWKSLTEYDLTFLLNSGKHVLAVEALNDSLEAGILLGLRIHFVNGEEDRILSDDSWFVVPNNLSRWQHKRHPSPAWQHARVVGVVGQSPWWLTPISVIPTEPPRPPEPHFWQSVWFMGGVLLLCVVAIGLSIRLAAKLTVQTRAQKLLEIERARIARDIHDDVGAALTQLVLQSEVAQTQFPADTAAHEHFRLLCERSREVSSALDEVIWAVNSKHDTLRDFSSYVCKYAQAFLKTTPIRCRLDIQSNMPASVFDLPVRRGLLLAVKEALNNAAKYSEATELFLRIFRDGGSVLVIVEDNGKGFDPDSLSGDRNGLTNMVQRLQDLGGICQIFSNIGAGCRVEFKMPLAHPASRAAFSWRNLWKKPRPQTLPTAGTPDFTGIAPQP
ncbi:MAG TPA: ATP-binding protein [Candidatus Paceibacterota bacterium]|nr:ATP-binding protein [Candidatus Paceibacterota bacterium]